MSKRKNLGGRRILCGDGIVRTLYDADYIFSATITAEDNENPICGNPNECVIAHAVTRVEAAQGRTVTVSIGADKAYIQRSDTVLRFQVPPNEAALTRTFDAIGAFPVGFTFHLVPVRPSDRLGVRPKDAVERTAHDHRHRHAVNDACRRAISARRNPSAPVVCNEPEGGAPAGPGGVWRAHPGERRPGR